jgi:hypothetical protein
MGLADELAYMSAAETALRIRRRDFSPVEVVDALIALHREPQSEPQRFRLQGIRRRAQRRQGS